MLGKLKYLILCLSVLFLFSFNAHAEVLKDLFHKFDDPIGGNPKGKITVVEFFDYQCSHCIDMLPVMNETIKHNQNVRLIFKELPVRGGMSEYAARVALAAKKQGKYVRFNHALMAAGKTSLTKSELFKIAKSAGLNIDQLKKDLQHPTITKQLKNNRLLAEKLNVTGTPAFFIGKTNTKNINEVVFVLGEMSKKQLQNEINNLR